MLVLTCLLTIYFSKLQFKLCNCQPPLTLLLLVEDPARRQTITPVQQTQMSIWRQQSITQYDFNYTPSLDTMIWERTQATCIIDLQSQQHSCLKSFFGHLWQVLAGCLHKQREISFIVVTGHP